MLNKIRKNLTGFTLVELLVSIFIIGLITAIFTVNYHNTSKRSELKMAAQKLVSDIRLTQNYSLGSKTYNGTEIALGGWGVHFDMIDQTHYIIFADIGSIPNQVYNAGEAIETKLLPAGVTINSLKTTDAAGVEMFPAPTNVDIIFLPPDPVTYVNGLPTARATIILQENINNSTAKVTVNSFGLIDTE